MARAIYKPIYLEGEEYEEVVARLLQLRRQMGTQIGGVYDGGRHRSRWHLCNNECKLRVPLLRARKRFMSAQEKAIAALDGVIRVFTSVDGGCPRGNGWIRNPLDDRARALRAKEVIARLDKRKKMR